ncbi:hypothetical protein ACLOAU_03330 [Niabella sp. CJ426]|uniref:hypothetical protein n=1 Tax=Niabella sp. CJ426 TaxID=3393740 RepID=UPI003CFCC887
MRSKIKLTNYEKKLLLTVGIIISCTGFAQKGTVLVGGNVEFKKTDNLLILALTSETNGTSRSSELAPYIGYQFSEKLTAGATLSVISSKYENVRDVYYPGVGYITFETTSKGKDWVMGPFLRYTEKLSDIFSVFGQLEGLYMSGKRNLGTQTIYPENFPEGATQLTREETSFNGVQFRLFPAVFVNIKKNFGLNLSIGGVEYQKYGQKDSDKKPSSFGLSFGKTASIGVSKNF